MKRKKVIPRIKAIEPKENFILRVEFDDGKKVEYDVQKDINQIQSFGILKTEYALFQNFQLDQTRTVVTWSEDVDLPSDTLYEFGKSVY